MSAVLQPDSYFLSASNPTCNVDQIECERLALEVLRLPLVARAVERMAMRWRRLVGRDAPEEAWSRFDELVSEWAFHYAIKAVNADANYPKVVGHLFGPPHRWRGMDVPGSRASGGDNPDSNQLIIPVDAYARFELHGKRLDRDLADVPFQLCGDVALATTLTNFAWDDVKFEDDDSFVMTLDPEPANGRRNHIQTKPDARYLFVRDCRSDWRQTPNAYRIHRLDPPVAAPLSLEQIGERAARYMFEDVPLMYSVMRAAAMNEANVMAQPFNAGSIGGMPTQTVCLARLSMGDDEAYVITTGPSTARYRNIVLHDSWMRTFDYWKRVSTMNNAQAAVSADGSTTYVVSAQDPGVHNWLDTSGFRELLLVHRWQVPRQPETPWIKGELVKSKELDRALPRDIKTVNAAERKQQLAQRLEAFNLRFVDA